MKKLLSLVLVLSLVLGSFGMAFAAPADVAGTDFEDAVERLGALGILTGFPDGTFKPNDTITRAQFAAVVVRALGYDSAAKASLGATNFTDVVAGHWAAGYINVATSLKVINGMGDGTFAPEAPVTFEQAVTMIVRALGYEPAAQEKGGYPNGYLVVASEEDITDDVDGVVGSPASRGIVSLLVDNSLEVAKMVQTGYGDDKKFVKSGTDGTTEKNLLTDNLGMTKANKERVIAIPRVDNKLDDNEIKLETTGVVEVADGFDFEEVFGVRITAYINDDDEVVAYTLKDDVYFDAMEFDGTDEITLIDADEDYDLLEDADDVIVYIDGDKEDVDTLAANSVYDYAKVVTNADDEVVFIEVFEWDGVLAVSEVDGNDVLGYDEDLDAEDYTIVKDGKLISVADVKTGDLFFYDESSEFAEVYTNEAKSGEIKKIYTDRMDVDGTTYKFFNTDFGTAGMWIKFVNADEEIDAFSLADGEDIAEQFQDGGDITVFVNRAGDPVFITGDLGESKTTSFYAYVTENSASFADRTVLKWTLDVITEKGEEIEYSVKDSDVNAAAVVAGDNLLLNGAWIAGSVNKHDIVEITLDSDGDIDSVEVLAADHAAVVNVDVKDDKFVSTTKHSSSAVVFLVEDYLTSDDVDDIEAATYGELDFEDILLGDFYANGGTSVQVVVVQNSDRNPDTTDYLALATAASTKVSGEDTWRVKLIIENGEEQYYYTEEDENVLNGIDLDLDGTDGMNAGEYYRVTMTDDDQVITAATPLAGDIVSGTVTAKDIQNKRLTVGGNVYRLMADATLVDTDYDVVSFGDIKVGDTVTLYRAAAGSLYVQFVVYAEAGAAPAVPVVEGDYTFVSADVANKLLTLRDANNAVKVFALPAAGATTVEKTDGTLSDLTTEIAATLDAGDEINIVLTEGTNDVTYITVRVDN